MESFQPTGFSEQIFKDRYVATLDETWTDACLRVARQMALAEVSTKQKMYEDKFYSILSSNLFVAGGRIWANSGRINPQLLNCFVLDPNKDSKEGWGNSAKNMIITSMTGGGCGDDFSDVRPKGAAIGDQRGTAPGAVELMRLIDACAKPVKAGGQRRVALMFSLDLDHPDVDEFLDAKLQRGQLTHANVSVRSKKTKEFIKAVEKDGDWDLVWKNKFKRTIKARDLWNKIVSNAYNSAEPGFLNWELVENESNIHYIESLVTTNPCIVGNTLIATADGRNAVSIAQLTAEGKDIPVYSTNPNTGQVEIKTGRNPRKTGVKSEVWKLTLDDGSIFTATPNHKILLKNLNYVELKDLKPGDSIFPFNSFDNNGYRQICNSGQRLSSGNGHRNKRQYRLISEFYNGPVDGKITAIHHRDFDSYNDNVDNLQLMPHADHKELHSLRMRGRDNLYHRFTKEQKFKFASHPGVKNPKWISVSNEELIEHGKNVLKMYGSLNTSIWSSYAKKQKLPRTLNNKARFGTFDNFKSLVIGNHKVVSIDFVGYEDVYNITVDDNHNYHVITSNQDDRYIKSSGICVKNCGEIALSAYDCCCLGHLVLPRFIKDGQIDYSLLGDTIRTSVRFLDNVLTVNSYPLPEMRDKSQKLRRIGLGTTGLADLLVLLGYRYGSEEGNKFIDKLFRFISKAAYESSVMLAVEKGMFPLCKPDKHVESGFVKRMPAKIKSLILEHGIRNCAILTQAPTGTVSILSGNCSSGIEPIFAFAYERRYWDNDERKTELVFHPLFSKFMNEGKDLSSFVSSRDLSVRDHMEVQKIVQRHVDNAVSKTINIAEDYPMEDMAKLWLEYMPYLKGTTFYRENTRGYVDDKGIVHEPPLKALSIDEAKQKHSYANFSDKTEVDCASGVCEI
jgi:ribonucleotide reductase alpha subunit